jgi:hypothetical protein
LIAIVFVLDEPAISYQPSAFSYQFILLKLHFASTLGPLLRTKQAEG